MAHIMTTKELSRYLKLHEITICKYAAEGQIPAIRIGRVWRFDKEVIDQWISGNQRKPPVKEKSKTKNKSADIRRHVLRKKEKVKTYLGIGKLADVQFINW